MGSSIAYWYIPNHIIFVDNVGDLTVPDFWEVDEQIIALMQESVANGISQAQTHVIVDCTELQKLPSITQLEGGRILKYFGQPNCGWTMIVGYRKNPFLVILSRLLTSIMRKPLHMAESLADAQKQIAWLLPDIKDIPDIELWKKENITTQISEAETKEN